MTAGGRYNTLRVYRGRASASIDGHRYTTTSGPPLRGGGVRNDGSADAGCPFRISVGDTSCQHRETSDGRWVLRPALRGPFGRFVLTYRVFVLPVLMTVIVSTSVTAERSRPYNDLRRELLPYRAGVASQTENVRRFYATCLSPSANLSHDTWRLVSRDVVIAVHVWGARPREQSSSAVSQSPRGTVLVVHGYLANPCELSGVIDALIESGFIVVAPELPGHGLSGGTRADITSFSDYGALMTDLDVVLESLPRPHHVVAHSTGASAAIERFRTAHDPYDDVVFLAPLIRSSRYQLSRIARFFTRPFLSSVPTRNPGQSGIERMPLHWFDELVRWNRVLAAEGKPLSRRPILVIQGATDDVVAWRYNLRWIELLFSRSDIVVVPDLGHVPSAQTAAGRAFISTIVDYLISPIRYD